MSKLYTEEQMIATLRKYWPMGNEYGYRKYLNSLTPEPSADVVDRIESKLNEMIDWVESPYRIREMAEEIAPLITAEVERRVSGYRQALEMVRSCSINPAHTMTKNGLEECLDACNKVASQALVKGTEQ